MDFNSILQQVAVMALPVLTAITLHEVAHGWAARRCGDRTAEAQGRLSLNPLRHVDPMGTVLVPGVLLLLGAPFLFGWAKPVPVNPNRFRHYRQDWVKVAAAGPASNLVMALLWGLLLVAVVRLFGAGLDAQPYGRWLAAMSQFGLQFNVVLAVFNLLPSPPLDGGRVLTNLLPPRSALVKVLEAITPYGLFIVMGLVATRLLGVLISPPIDWVLDGFNAVLSWLI